MPIFVPQTGITDVTSGMTQYGITGGFDNILRKVSMNPDTYQSLVDAYASENGSIITNEASPVKIDSDVTINGNISDNTQVFEYAEDRNS